jgi:amino acid transporter
MVVGIVIGSGIFRLPSLVAGNVDTPTLFLLLWVLGGAISFVGALVYSELASAFPSAGGDYHFLMRAYGRPVAFLFAWARMTVMQTGSIALVAFVFGDFAGQLVALGPYSSSIYAAAAIVSLTALNVLGTWQGKWAQNVLTTLIVIGLLAAVAAAFGTPPVPPSPAPGGTVRSTSRRAVLRRSATTSATLEGSCRLRRRRTGTPATSCSTTCGPSPTAPWRGRPCRRSRP